MGLAEQDRRRAYAGLARFAIIPARAACRGVESAWMIYLKSALFGVGGAVLAALLWIIVAAILPMFLQYLSWRLAPNAGAGAVGGSIEGLSILIAALVGFIAAVTWEWSRVRSAMS